MVRPFMTARWLNLILAQYPVDDHLLAPYLPAGLELDRWQGQAYVSLVGFQFVDARVFGIRWPGYQHFPEWNLRVYVRQGDRRGVLFIREYVPQWLVAAIARWMYNEPYRKARFQQQIEDNADSLRVSYQVRVGGRDHRLWARGAKPAATPEPDSLEHFFKEHTWGFGRNRRGKLTQFAVEHPIWETFPVQEFGVEIDWGVLYGPEWAGMNHRSPASVILARGSEIAVYPNEVDPWASSPGA